MDLRWISDLEVREDGVVVHEAVQQEKKRKACGEGKPEATRKEKTREEIGSKAYLRGEANECGTV